MNISIATNTINSIVNKIWYGVNPVIYKFSPINYQAYENTDVPFYFYLYIYSPSDRYDSNRYEIKGGVTLDGTIFYSDGRKGRIIGENISWADGEMWQTYKQQIPGLIPDKFTKSYIQRIQQSQSNMLNNAVNSAYPRNIPFQGL